MLTFDLVEVRRYVANANARMDRCQNGEGMECATLDAAVRHQAMICCDFTAKVREWGQHVFAGRVAFDPEVESVWREEGLRLFARAMEMYKIGQKAEVPCYILEGSTPLASALWGMSRLLHNWVTPRRAVGPSARRGLTPTSSTSEEARGRIASLPSLPADWQPDDQQQRAMHRMLQTP